MAAARSCSALPAQYINPVLPQGYYRDLQTESLGLIICQHVWKCVPSVVAEQILSQSWLVNVSGAPPCLPGYLTPDRDRDSCISLCHALGGAVGTSGHLQHQDPGLKYQNNCGKRGILITKAEIFEVTNVSVLYSSSLPWPNVVVWRWYMIMVRVDPRLGGTSDSPSYAILAQPWQFCIDNFVMWWQIFIISAISSKLAFPSWFCIW